MSTRSIGCLGKREILKQRTRRIAKTVRTLLTVAQIISIIGFVGGGALLTLAIIDDAQIQDENKAFIDRFLHGNSDGSNALGSVSSGIMEVDINDGNNSTPSEVSEPVEAPIEEPTVTNAFTQLVGVPSSANAVLDVDITALQQTNPNALGWVQCTAADTFINFPLVKSVDNTDYLNTSISGSQSKAGCIFLDFRTDYDMTENYIVYGHNMGSKTGPMFSKLQNYLDKEYLAQHQEILLNLEGAVSRWKVFAINIAQIVDEEAMTKYLRTSFNSHKEYTDYLQNICETAEINLGYDDVPDRILTLCTCLRSAGDARTRLLVTAALVP